MAGGAEVAGKLEDDIFSVFPWESGRDGSSFTCNHVIETEDRTGKKAELESNVQFLNVQICKYSVLYFFQASPVDCN